MRWIVVWIALLLWLWGAPLWAAQITVAWNPTGSASEYRLYQSVDLGQTWTLVETITAPTTQATITVPDDVLVLLKVSAFDGTDNTTSDWQGAWFHSGW